MTQDLHFLTPIFQRDLDSSCDNTSHGGKSTTREEREERKEREEREEREVREEREEREEKEDREEREKRERNHGGGTIDEGSWRKES